MAGSWVQIVILTTLLMAQHPLSEAIRDSPNESQCSGISRGREFMVGFIDNTNDFVHNQLYILVVAFSDKETDVTISSKYEVTGRPLEITFLIEAGGFRRTAIPVEYTMSGTERSFKGLKIKASSEVSAYGLMFQDYTTDGFLGIPINNLGKQYVVVTASGSLPEFAVIGTQGATTVQATVTNTVTFEGRTYTSGDVITFEIGEMEAVQIQSAGDLTGSLIQSDKPVTVFSGNECFSTPGSACDTLTEQLVPVNSWGKRHIYSASKATDRNLYRIVAYFSETKVTIPGSSDIVLNAGEFWEGYLVGSGLVSSSEPTVLMQFLAEINGLTVDPSLIQIPSEVQFDFVFGFTTPPYSGGGDSQGFYNFLNIVVNAEARQTVYLNGQPITDANEHDVPGTSYVVVTVQLPRGEGVYFVEQTNQQSPPMSVIVFGYENDETYGYATGLSLPSSKQLLSFTPYYFREFGSEYLTVTLPCVESDLINQDVLCKFETGIEDLLVPGDRVDFYTVVCMTPTFHKLGLVQVSVSVNAGETFPYSGIIYVASQEDLPPPATVRQVNWEERGESIDLNLEDDILINWDPNDMGPDVTHVDLMIRASELNDDGIPIFVDDVLVLSSIPNNGSVTVIPQLVNLDFTTADRSHGSTVAAFFLKVGSVIANTATKIVKYAKEAPCSAFDDALKNVATDLPPCPCETRQAAADPNFQQANFLTGFYHPGSEDCYRSTTATERGSGQQCCYTREGSLVFGPRGGGTADRFSLDGFFNSIRHQFYDVLPWFACCKFTDECDKYYAYRPSDDCSGYDPPSPGQGNGDPHITTLDGKTFTFNGAGEFMMASSSFYNVSIQARMEVYGDTDASVYTAIAIQTNGSAKVQVQRSNTDETLILIDGELLRQSSNPIGNYFLTGVRVSFNDDLSEVRVVFNSGVTVIISINNDVMSFITQLGKQFKGQMEGLLGDMDGNPDNDFRFPNGTVLKNDSSLSEIHKYGLEWLVVEEDSIFTYISPYDYSTYFNPNFVPVFDIPTDISEEISDLCGESFECIFDAVTTGSLVFANETLVSSTTFKVIQESSVKVITCGFPGNIENGQLLGSVYLVNNTVEATCNEGYALEGAPALFCQEDGMWSADLPQCNKSEDITILTVIAIVIGTLLGIGVIFLVVFCVCRVTKK